jgi:cobalt transporter subunit CbtA
MCLAAVAAGLLAGALISLVQHFTTTPLIIRAETFERAAVRQGGEHDTAGSGVGSGVAAHHADTHHHHGSGFVSQAEPAAVERLLFTILADVLVGVGSAFLVVAALAWGGEANIRGRTGLAWGAAGFVVFTLAPSLGLPPELPGVFAAELAARQLWWTFAAASAAVGLGLLTFGPKTIFKALGVVVALVPHFVGAPAPEALGGDVAPELAGQFAATSIAVSALFWAVLGWLSAVFYRRFGENA